MLVLLEFLQISPFACKPRLLGDSLGISTTTGLRKRRLSLLCSRLVLVPPSRIASMALYSVIGLGRRQRNALVLTIWVSLRLVGVTYFLHASSKYGGMVLVCVIPLLRPTTSVRAYAICQKLMSSILGIQRVTLSVGGPRYSLSTKVGKLL